MNLTILSEILPLAAGLVKLLSLGMRERKEGLTGDEVRAEIHSIKQQVEDARQGDLAILDGIGD